MVQPPVLDGNPFTQNVVARLEEFFSETSAWFRGLWDIGAVLALKELLEVAEAPSAILPETVKWLRDDLAGSCLKDDPGVERGIRRELLQLLVGDFGRGEKFALRRLLTRLERSYLECCSGEIQKHIELTAQGKKGHLSVERTSRAIATHLLSLGYSKSRLSGWLRHQARDPGTTVTLVDLVAKAGELAAAQPRKFVVLVPVLGTVDQRQAAPEIWRSARTVREWLRTRGLPRAMLRQSGGWLFEIDALDPFAASEKAAELADRLAARLLIGDRRHLRDLNRAFIDGDTRSFPLRRRRRVEVRSLQRQAQLFTTNLDGGGRVDAAFELLAQMEGALVAAAAAGWAAIEALLIDAGNSKVSSGDRLANLVACSFPRAELTLLAAQVDPKSALGAELAVLGRDNRARAKVMARALKEAAATRAPLPWPDQRQVAAAERITKLVVQPKTIDDLVKHATRVFRRLYRQRNMVVHGGFTKTVALDASLRTAAPLLGAGMDRIAHSWFVERVEPLELASRANARLPLVESSDDIVDLLE